MFKVPERFRWENAPNGMRSTKANGNNGVFRISQKKGPMLRVIASDGEGWEHVSVSLPDRTPTWEEMCFIKGLFWSDEDCVVQYHPPKSEYVNTNNYCLHLWAYVLGIPRPPSIMVG